MLNGNTIIVLPFMYNVCIFTMSYKTSKKSYLWSFGPFGSAWFICQVGLSAAQMPHSHQNVNYDSVPRWWSATQVNGNCTEMLRVWDVTFREATEKRTTNVAVRSCSLVVRPTYLILSGKYFDQREQHKDNNNNSEWKAYEYKISGT